MQAAAVNPDKLTAE